MPKARAVGLAVALLLVVGVGGCGGSGGSQPAGSLRVSMTDYRFSPGSIDARAGKVVFYLVNEGRSAHDMTILAPDGHQVQKSELVQPGDSSVFTIAGLGAGSYRFICSQPGHEQSGMTGTLQVS